MKTLFTILFLISVQFSSFSQHVIVDNKGGENTDYLNLQTAINNANHGDSIIVRPSDVSYGEVAISKHIVLLSEDIVLKNEKLNTTRIEKLILENISYDKSDASNSTICGFEIHKLEAISDPDNAVRNITFAKNKLKRKPQIKDIKTWIITQNTRIH
ncbi:hypothetical protein EI427_21795 [Flammeovirga pectinis]|uniref:Pectate lyase superfamily protein domain-containing protein n=1 Tax=Flammeovirga pectinis TaxID=2494373 RepID=A0A3S9P9H1_9BACT|nr:hypothetical protein [Flammeovirga pectinis]AZQ64861.1 hypothetical protein EI427_21795 [Flammeovirga pectinis]